MGRALILLLFIGACTVRDDQDEENPPVPTCTPDGDPVCPAGYEVECLDLEKPDPVCFEGEPLCEKGGEMIFPPYTNPECISDEE